MEDVVNTVAPAAAEGHSQPVEKFFSASEARSDKWRELNAAATAWASAKEDGAAAHQRVIHLFNELSPMEDYWSYPGPGLMRSLKDSLDAHDAGTFARLAQRIGRALLSEFLQARSYCVGSPAGIAGAVGTRSSAGRGWCWAAEAQLRCPDRHTERPRSIGTRRAASCNICAAARTRSSITS